MEVLFLSHCVPYPPNKGEKIRAHFEVAALASMYKLHLACYAQAPAERDQMEWLERHCASVYVEERPRTKALMEAGLRFIAGGCLNESFYRTAAMKRYVEGLLRRRPITAAVAFSGVMAQYVPETLPMVLDLIDVDSAKWTQYAESRWPAPFFRAESRRLREMEIRQSRRAEITFLTTENEQAVFENCSPPILSVVMENGVDFSYFDPSVVAEDPRLAGRNYLVFVACFDYYPNAEGAVSFARNVWPLLRERDPGLELILAGRNPVAAVRQLHGRQGITVTGQVPDIRPYVKSARAVIVPLSIARGIQNKVLEGLAMCKPVLVSPEVAQTLKPELPPGIVVCENATDYWRALQDAVPQPAPCEATRKRFSWQDNLQPLIAALGGLRAARPAGSVRGREDR